MTTPYTFEQLKEDVRKEAEALRVHATSEERERLDFGIFNPTVQDECIYGQMTGHCFSGRAARLIKLCTQRYFNHSVLPDLYGEITTMNHIVKNVNGKDVADFLIERTHRQSMSHFSAIEAYILLPEANNANLISFLRGETETLTL